MVTIFTDLVLDTGELISVECPGKYEDEFWDSIRMTMKRKDHWAPGRFDGCKASFMGLDHLQSINMARVVATL